MDDNEEFMDLLVSGLKQINPDLEIDTTTTPERVLDQLNHQSYDVIISDNHMPYLSGYDLLHQIRTQNRQIHLIMLTGQDNFEFKAKVLALGVECFETKQTSFLILIHEINQCIQHRVSHGSCVDCPVGCAQ